MTEFSTTAPEVSSDPDEGIVVPFSFQPDGPKISMLALADAIFYADTSYADTSDIEAMTDTSNLLGVIESRFNELGEDGEKCTDVIQRLAMDIRDGSDDEDDYGMEAAVHFLQQAAKAVRQPVENNIFRRSINNMDELWERDLNVHKDDEAAEQRRQIAARRYYNLYVADNLIAQPQAPALVQLHPANDTNAPAIHAGNAPTIMALLAMRHTISLTERRKRKDKKKAEEAERQAQAAPWVDDTAPANDAAPSQAVQKAAAALTLVKAFVMSDPKRTKRILAWTAVAVTATIAAVAVYMNAPDLSDMVSQGMAWLSSFGEHAQTGQNTDVVRHVVTSATSTAADTARVATEAVQQAAQHSASSATAVTHAAQSAPLDQADTVAQAFSVATTPQQEIVNALQADGSEATSYLNRLSAAGLSDQAVGCGIDKTCIANLVLKL